MKKREKENDNREEKSLLKRTCLSVLGGEENSDNARNLQNLKVNRKSSSTSSTAQFLLSACRFHFAKQKWFTWIVSLTHSKRNSKLITFATAINTLEGVDSNWILCKSNQMKIIVDKWNFFFQLHCSWITRWHINRNRPREVKWKLW